MILSNFSGSTSTLTVNMASGTTNYGGVLANGLGTLSLTLSGAGTLVLSGTGSYGGGTTVSGGVLQLGSAGALSTAGSLTVSGGTLDLGTFTATTTAAVSFQGGVTQNGTIVNNGAAYDGQAGTVSASLQGTAGLNKRSGGTLLLSGNNSYGGGTTINAGAVAQGVANALPYGSAAGDLTINSPGLFLLNGQNAQINGLWGNGTVDSQAGSRRLYLDRGQQQCQQHLQRRDPEHADRHRRADQDRQRHAGPDRRQQQFQRGLEREQRRAASGHLGQRRRQQQRQWYDRVGRRQRSGHVGIYRQQRRRHRPPGQPAGQRGLGCLRKYVQHRQ